MDNNTLITLAAGVKNAGDAANTARANRDTLSALLEQAEQKVGDADRAHRDAVSTMTRYIDTGTLYVGAPQRAYPPPPVAPAMPMAPPVRPFG